MFSRLMTRVCVYGLPVVAMLSWCQAVEAQNAPGANETGERAAPVAERGKNYILRTYDVSDLIVKIEDRPFSDSLLRSSPLNQGVWRGGGGMGGGGFGGGGGGGFFSVPGEADGAGHTPRSRFQFAHQVGAGGGDAGEMGSGDAGPSASITMPDIVRVITNTVAADSWSVSGGEGQIEPLGTALVIWQAEDVQVQIGELLRQLGKVAADHRTVTIDARWLMLTSDELESLLLDVQEKGVPQVDREELARLTRRPGSIRGVTSCLSSQLVYLVSGTMKNVVGGYIPVVGSVEIPDRDVQLAGHGTGPQIHLVADGAVRSNGPQVGYQPVTTNLNFGAVLEIRPTLTPANSEAPVMVDLKSTVTFDGDAGGGAETKAAAGEIAPAVDRIAIETLEFATTLRMPLKMPVLVGGLTYIPSSDEGVEGAAEAEKPQLYLVLEVK